MIQYVERAPFATSIVEPRCRPSDAEVQLLLLAVSHDWTSADEDALDNIWGPLLAVIQARRDREPTGTGALSRVA
jgi:hypothetical protein